MFDLIVRGGTIADGSGAAVFCGDVAIAGNRIVEVGKISGAARRTLDADGLLVTPGFVDVHTHYDGQATWDPQLAPSCWHGVTTLVMGNCGVGFAPRRPGREAFLIELMEGVEDIPGPALAEGIAWSWESFPEYLDALERRRWMVDVGTQVPHAAVRAYVMDERAIRERPTPLDLERMREIALGGLRAGALGVSTSRILAHRSSRGAEVPGTFADTAELEALASALTELGTGVFEVVPRGMDGEVSASAHAEIDWMGRLAQRIGRPLTFSLVQTHTELDRFRDLLERARELRAAGTPIYPQVANRSTGILVGLQTDNNAFSTRPSYREIARKPLAERVRRMRDPALRARILAEPNGTYAHPLAALVHTGFANLLPLGDPIDWEPGADQTVAARAAREGRSPEELYYDLILENAGRNLLLFPFTNYFRFSLDDVHAMLTHPASVFGLGDGGAHCGVACDASSPTLMLSHWARDRSRGPRIPVETAVRWMTLEPATLYGLCDRGRIAPGYKADLNLIDAQRIHATLPEMVFDLPAGGRRIMQRTRGYRATIASGEVTLEYDEATGALPGRLIRGAQSIP